MQEPVVMFAVGGGDLVCLDVKRVDWGIDKNHGV